MTNKTKKNDALRKELGLIVADSSNILQVESKITETLRRIKTSPEEKIGYISAILSSDGPKHIQTNIKILDKYTEFYRDILQFPVFSSSDIFIGKHVEKFKLTGKEWISFWNNVLKFGQVTDIFMTPRWEESIGAKEEHKTAKELGLNIHYDHKNVDLIRTLRNMRRDLDLE